MKRFLKCSLASVKLNHTRQSCYCLLHVHHDLRVAVAYLSPMSDKAIPVDRLREQWELEERSKSLEQTRSVKQRPNPPSSCELESIQNLLLQVERRVHKGKHSFFAL